MMMNLKKNFIKLFKTFIKSILLLVIFLDPNAYPKPIPPGSGVGDVPANILFLLDNSLSMRRQVVAGDSMYNSIDVVETDAGNLIYAQERGLGLVKFSYSTQNKDGTFANNTAGFRGTSSDANCDNKNSKLSRRIRNMGISGLGNSDETDDLIYVSDMDNKKIVIVNYVGICQDVIDLNFHPRTMVVRTFGGEVHLIAMGSAGSSRYVYSRNVTDGTFVEREVSGLQIGNWLLNANSITIDGAGGTPNWLYISYWNHGRIAKFAVTDNGSQYEVSQTLTTWFEAEGRRCSSGCHRQAYGIEVDPDDDEVMYISSFKKHRIQRVTIPSTTGGGVKLTVTHTKGQRGRTQTTVADTVYLKQPMAMFVGSVNGNFIYTAGRKPSGQAFAQADLTWQSEIGGGGGSRISGAKAAIRAIITDSSLTTGAHYGYGYWSAGNPFIAGQTTRNCHRQRRTCDYWSGWSGTNEAGTSSPCTNNACIRVGVHGQGFAKIDRQGLARTRLIFGTDATAFSQFAYEYYSDDTVSPLDTSSTCQLNYAIVIGDGAWTGHDRAALEIEKLRTEHKVKTLVVAYGGGISTSGLNNFKRMAVTGSCNADPDASAEDLALNSECEPVIVANTPTQLKTQLKSKITQIIADRLSFTAPSITATLEGEGSLYQAQFSYEQHEEWQGTILKKTINEDLSINHDSSYSKNWNAADQVRTQAAIAEGDDGARKIWTVLDETAPYIGNWNNFTTTNKDLIENLFLDRDMEVVDYHRETADSTGSTIQKRCSADNPAIVGSFSVLAKDGIADDIEGLINFTRGQDWFDYNGNCDLTEIRDHVLGDLYHSQLINVSKPNANTAWKSKNEEAYWRAKKNYVASFVSAKGDRKEVIYAGGNDGMLHAFNADTGDEEWAFIPPYIAGQLPTIGNQILNKGPLKGGGGTNAIFGVDGSPVIHDMYFSGVNLDGSLEIEKSWHTIMIVPYGRGGAGFSILDITHPILKEDKGPLHLFSVFNDTVHRKVLWTLYDGSTDEEEYAPTFFGIEDTEEAILASDNETGASDIDTSAQYTCSDTTSALWISAGTASCYKGTEWTLNTTVDCAGLINTDFEIMEGATDITANTNVSCSGGMIKITFNNDKTFTASQSDAVPDDYPSSSQISFELLDLTKTGLSINSKDAALPAVNYDYSLLGETWSTPRVFRLPNEGAGDTDIEDDQYVMVMGGGMGSASRLTGSNVYVINLEDKSALAGGNNEGKFGSIEKVLQIPDKLEGGIYNSTPATPVVITPDMTVGIPWRGALVYQPDLEGKITKINLTNMETDSAANDVAMYDMMTLFDIGASTTNGRYMFHSLDAGIGLTKQEFWLFGGTGDYEGISFKSDDTDNILFGLMDSEYPFFKNVTNYADPEPTDGFGLTLCSDTTSFTTGCPVLNHHMGWYIKLDHSKKVTAEPTLFRGDVYYPIYMPAAGTDLCNLGSAFICSVDDECGINNTEDIVPSGETLNQGTEFAASETATSADDPEKCLYIDQGILSELVIFGDKLFANIAGPSRTEDTLISVDTGIGDFIDFRRSWKQNF